MKFAARFGISSRLTLITTSIIFFSFGLLGLFIFENSQGKIQKSLEMESNYILDLAVSSLREPLWVFDRKALESLTVTLVNQGQSTFVAIRVFDSNQAMQIEKFNPFVGVQDVNLLLQDPDYHLYERKITYNSENIGSVQVVLSVKEKKAEIFRLLIYLTLITLFLACMVSVSIFVLTRKMLLHPLKKLTGIAAKMEKGIYQIEDQVWEHEFEILGKGLRAAIEAVQKRDQDLKVHAENLESLIAARTKELDQQRVRSFQSAQLATLGEMSAGIAHEINNPLAVINAQSQILRKSLSDNPKAAEKLDKVIAMSKRISNIVRGLRTFARDGSKDPMSEFPVTAFVAEVQDLCYSRMKSLRIEFHAQYPEDLKAYGREVQISQVLLNLINNAIDAIEKLPQKWIRLEIVDRGHDIVMSVTDSGSGIPAELREKIMQPFFTTKDVGKGTGLGLSISIGIARDHGGDLIYDSNSENTRFEIRLPKAPSSSQRAS